MNDFPKGNARGHWGQMVTTVLRKTSGFDWLAIIVSCLLPSDLPCTGSTLYTYNVHSPSGDRCVMYKNECETNFRKKKRASPVCEHYSSPPPLLPCEVRQPAQPCTATSQARNFSTRSTEEQSTPVPRARCGDGTLLFTTEMPWGRDL